MTRQKPGSGSQKTPGRLRIVAGKWRSRLLAIADLPGLRPTSARIRETLFNWLGPGIVGKRCLDLCAGTGALGLEALSRGAAHCTFVENARPAAQTLRRNVAALEADNASVIEGDAVAFLTNRAGESFDLVFIDPPFADELQAHLCRLLAESSLLNVAAQVYLEEPDRGEAAPLPDSWSVLKDRRAGNVRYRLIDVARESDGVEQ